MVVLIPPVAPDSMDFDDFDEDMDMDGFMPMIPMMPHMLPHPQPFLDLTPPFTLGGPAAAPIVATPIVPPIEPSPHPGPPGPPRLHLPEILLHLFSYLSAGDLYNNALVCRTWLPTARETLWTKRNVALSAFLNKIRFMQQPETGRIWDIVSRRDIP